MHREPLRRLALAAIAGLAFAAPAAAQDLCLGLTQDRLPHPMTALAKPAQGKAVLDPQFGTRIRRVTQVAPGPGDSVIKPMYSTISAWNADESLLILYRVGRGHELYDGRTYAFIRPLEIGPNDIELVYWHTSDPDVLFYPSGNRLMRHRVSTAASETVETFTFCSGPVTAGSDPMTMSWDSSTVGLSCDGWRFIYDIPSGSVTGYTGAGGPAPQVAPSGRNAYMGGTVVDATLLPLRQLDLANAFEHASIGRRADGADTYNAVVFDQGPLGGDVGSLVTFDMDTGDWQVVVGPATGFPYPPSMTHVSAVAHRAPGWVFVSVVGDPSGRGVLDNEILLADTNTGRVCRVAHHRSFGNRNTTMGTRYWAEPHVVASPTGSRALFASDWGNGATVDTYALELPAYQPLTVSTSTDRDSYGTGDEMVLSLGIDSLASPDAADFYLLWLLPDGDSLLAFTGGGTTQGRLSDPAGLAPLASAVPLGAPFEWSDADALRYTWSGDEPAGLQAFVLAAIAPGALADGRFDPGDVFAVDAALFSFQP